MKEITDKGVELIYELPIGNQEPLDMTDFYDKKCECGSDKTYGPGSNTHSPWCPKYETPKKMS